MKRKIGILNELKKISNDDEALNALSNISEASNNLELHMAKFCERNPNNPRCVGVDSYETVLKRQNMIKERLKAVEEKEIKRQKKWINPNKWYTYDNWFVIVFIFFPIPFGIYGGIMRLISKNPNLKVDSDNNTNTSSLVSNAAASSVVSKYSEEKNDESFWRHPFLVKELPVYLIMLLFCFFSFIILIGMFNNKFS